MLTLGAWYNSDTFWAAAAVVVAVIFGGLTAAATLYAGFGVWRRLLVYGTNGARPLRSSIVGGALHPALEVTYQRASLGNPHLITLIVECRSRKEVSREDFDGDKPLVFDLRAGVVSIIAAAIGGSQVDVHEVSGFSGTEVRIGPMLLRRGQPLTLDILTDGAPQVTYRANLDSLKQVKVKEQRAGERATRLQVGLSMATATVALVAATALLSAHLAAGARAPAPGPPLRIPHYRVIIDSNTSGVSSAAFSPNGGLLALGDFNGTTYLWNATTRRIASTLPNPNGQDIFGVAFGPGENILAVITQNKSYTNGDVYLWNIAQHALIATLHDPRAGAPDAVAFSPDDGILAVGDKNGGADLWDVATGKIIHTLPNPNGQSVRSVAFNPSGSVLAVASGHVDTTYLWNPRTYRIIRRISDSSGGGLNDLAFSPDGRTLAGADTDGNTYLWDVGNGKLVTTLRNPNGHQANSVAFSPDGRIVAVTTSYENAVGYIYLWNITTGTRMPIATLHDPGSTGTLADSFSPDSNILAVSDNNLSNYLWNMKRLPPRVFKDYRNDGRKRA